MECREAMPEADAIAAGFTRKVSAEHPNYSLDLLVKPDADLDGTFEAYCRDEGDIIDVNGWLFVIEPED